MVSDLKPREKRSDTVYRIHITPRWARPDAKAVDCDGRPIYLAVSFARSGSDSAEQMDVGIEAKSFEEAWSSIEGVLGVIVLNDGEMMDRCKRDWDGLFKSKTYQKYFGKVSL